MKNTFAILSLVSIIFTATAGSASEQVLKCHVRDYKNNLALEAPESNAQLTVINGQSGKIPEGTLRNGDYRCNVSYSFENGFKYLSIRLVRTIDGASAMYVDNAFEADKKTDALAQHMDRFGKRNLPEQTSEENFTPGACSCRTAE